jgi:two-component system response regulator FixJ
MPKTPRVHLVDDEAGVRSMVSTLLESVGIPVVCYALGNAFVDAFKPIARGCVVVDLCMEGMNGRQLQRWLIEQDARLPVIFITGHGDVETAVEALKDGALDFIQKPIDTRRLVQVVRAALLAEAQDYELQSHAASIDERLAQLTPGEREVLEGLVNGRNYKDLAEDLNVSYKTIEARRARVLRKMQAKSIAELMRLMLTRHAATAA